MGVTRISWLAAAGLFLAGASPELAYGQVEYVGPAARLTAALGGSLGDGMCDAGWIGHGLLTLGSERRLGRGETYRRRLAASVQTSAGAQRPSR